MIGSCLPIKRPELTKVSEFTLWNTSCIIFSHLKFIKVHFLTLFWLFGHWISPNGLKWHPGAPTHPDKFPKLGTFGSRFQNSVKSGWKYTKFATNITSNQNFDRDPPPVPLRARGWRDSHFRREMAKNIGFQKSVISFFQHWGPLKPPFLVLWQYLSNIYKITEGILKILIFWLFTAIYVPNFGRFFNFWQKIDPKVARKSLKIKIFKIPSVIL